MKAFSHRRTAFTLVEVMVSIAILGLVVAAIYSSWTAILRASKVGNDAAAAAQRSRITLHTLEDSLNAAELFVRNADYYGFVAENGSEATLSFVARLSKSFPRSGRFGDFDVRRLTFTLEKGEGGGKELVLRQQPLVMDWDEDEKNYPLVLARNVKEFAMEFFAPPPVNDWVDEWRQTNQLPKLIKLTLSLQHLDSRSVQTVEEVTRIVSLPSRGVPPNFQVPGMQPTPPGIGGPGAPPVIPSPVPMPGLQPPPR
jgi:prepilin-type N-terminal cleavage/methylation domain-containing protein